MITLPDYIEDLRSGQGVIPFFLRWYDMSEVVSKCGMNCAKCPWSPITRKHISDEEFPKMRKETKALLGYSPTEKPCLLCLTPDDKINKKDATHWHARFRKGCQVRKCVTNMGIKNCAYCSRFPCDFEQTHGGIWTREAYENIHGRPITDEEYNKYIEPFEALTRLQRIRKKLSSEEIVEAPTVPLLKAEVVEFPDSLSGVQAADFKKLHSVLKSLKESTLAGVDADLAIQQGRLQNRVKYLFRFLLILAVHGKLQEKNGRALVVDPETYRDNRGSETALMSVSTLENVIFPNLAKVGMEAEIVKLANDWKVPTGYLRRRGWEMKLIFTKKIGGLATLKALQNYGKALEEKFGKRAFRYFSDVDMNILVGN